MSPPSLERRSVAFRVQLRDDGGSTKAPTLVGYASTFNEPYPVHDWLGPYTETIAPGAFARAISSGQDVRLLVNHDGLPLARTKSGTLRLSEDTKGLRVEAELDSSDPDVAALMPKMRRGDLDQMSFVFRVPAGGDSWDSNYTERTVTDVDLFDVSVVTYPANPATYAAIRKVESVSTRTPEDLFEVRLRAAESDAGKSYPSNPEKPKSLSGVLRARRDVAKRLIIEMRAEQVAGLASERRSLEPVIDAGQSLLDDLELRIDELEAQEAREAVAARARAQMPSEVDDIGDHVGRHLTEASDRRTAGGVKLPAATITHDEPVYRLDDALAGNSSFFRDLYDAKYGANWQAAERLHRNNRLMGFDVSKRALSTTAGAGGQFAPPLWLVQEFVALARAGRVTADLCTKDVLQDGVSSVNLPTVATGASTGVQSTQNSALSQTDLTTNSVSSGISLIGGKQIVSLQLLRQSGIPFDRVILGDLAADYARQLDIQVINGSGSSGQLRGLLNGASVGTTTYTQATPAVLGAGGFYNTIIKAINAVNTSRYLPPTAIVMHPRRWAWVLEAVDTAGRPVVLSDGSAVNAIGVENSKAAQGAVGTLALLPVYIDANMPTNLGAGTNQDPVIVLRASDAFLYETELAMESFDATYADQASILFRALAFSAFLPDRYGPAVNVINGTGVVAPTL